MKKKAILVLCILLLVCGCKKESKTEAVQAVVAERMDDRDIHIGPSDYVPWQDDN